MVTQIVPTLVSTVGDDQIPSSDATVGNHVRCPADGPRRCVHQPPAGPARVGSRHRTRRPCRRCRCTARASPTKKLSGDVPSRVCQMNRSRSVRSARRTRRSHRRRTAWGRHPPSPAWACWSVRRWRVSSCRSPAGWSCRCSSFHRSCPLRFAPCSSPFQSDQKTMLLATIGWAKLSTPPLAVQCTLRVAALAVVSPVSDG